MCDFPFNEQMLIHLFLPETSFPIRVWFVSRRGISFYATKPASPNSWCLTAENTHDTFFSSMLRCLNFSALSVTLFIAFSIIPLSVFSADYFIDSVDGSDENNGRSKSSPWKSHTKAETASLSPGDVVHFKAGSAFSGNIEISESGTADKPIRLTSYGTGKRPRFTNPTTRHG